MQRYGKGLILAAVAFAVLVLLPLARADADHDHDVARDLFRHGEIHALSDILAVVRSNTPGDVVGVDLINQDMRWVYEVQVVRADGERTTIAVDAASAVIIPAPGGGG